MKIAAVFPTDESTPIEILRQEMEGVRTHFPAPESKITYIARADKISAFKTAFPDVDVSIVPNKFAPDDHVVLLDGYHLKNGFSADYETGNLAAAAGATTSNIKFTGRLMPYQRDWSEGELQNMNANVFNRLSPREPWGFYYYPYGYLFRFLGMGPINEIGCRITLPLGALVKRDRRHKVVACFGGSAGWSMYCLHQQMYTELLQRKLNAYCREQSIDLEFTVLNFGQHGHVVMNEMLTYLNFCWDLRPDVVVAHDGYNDLVYGQMCDPRLLEGNDVIYQENLEGWSQILHRTTDLPRTQDGLPYRAVNQPVRVLKAYAKRKRQFAQIVRSNGGMFVWGMQPAACSRKKKSPLEASLLERNLNRDYAPIVANVEGMFRIIRSSLRRDPDIPFVDCDARLGTFGADHFLIGDDVHLMPEGDEVLAGLYADAIKNSYIDSGQWQRS